MVPNMELPNGNECNKKPRRCCRKLANPSMVDTKPFWKDGTRMTITASLCQKLGGLRSRLFSMTNLHWKTTPILQQKRKELVTRKVGYSSWTKKVFKDHSINDLNSLKQNEKRKDYMMNMWKRLQEGTAPVHPIQRSRQRRNKQFEGLEEYKYQIDPQTGWRSYPSKSQGNLRHPTSSSSSTQWEQHDDWKSNKSWNSWRSSSWTEQQWCSWVQTCFFACWKVNSLAIDKLECVDRYTCRTLHFHMYSDCTGHAARMHVYIGTSLSCVPKIGHSSTRPVSPCASQYTEHMHKFSLTYFSCRKQTCCPRIHLSTVKIHGRMVLPRSSNPPQETKRSGTELWVIHLKETGILQPLRWWNDSKKQVIQCSRASVLLSRGILRTKNNRDTIHFNADASNTKLLFRILPSLCKSAQYLRTRL